MFDHRHYVPLLKWKAGEYQALKDLSAEVKKKLTPLIEIIPIPYDHINDIPAKTIDEHLKNVPDQIAKYWGSDQLLFVDLLWIEPSARMTNNKHPLSFILDECRGRSAKIVPVTGINRDEAYQKAIRTAATNDSKGFCLRLENEDFGTGELKNNINAFVKKMGISISEIDLMLDFKSILPNQENYIFIALMNIINSLPSIDKWRTVTLAGSGFPENLSGISANTVSAIPRLEWNIYLMHINRGKSPRLLTFGDYGIASPDYIEIDPRIMKMSANIRYTIGDEWLIFKGYSVKAEGFEQYYSLSDRVINHREYKGKRFSWGDKYIHACAAKIEGTGNATTWRRVGNTHHLTFVVDQIAKLP